MANPYVNDNAARAEVAGELAKLLADTYTLFVKTHGFHWNVVGSNFVSLHTLFETQYNELFEAVDTLAERIRALGAKAPGSFAEFKELRKIDEATSPPDSHEMIRQLVEGNTLAARAALRVAETADKHDDVSTADLATQRVTIHEKAAWMLGALLQK
jgi:starvation-inducible DNA-binding protein